MTCEATSQIEIELTDEEAASVLEAAKLAGITPEELCRIALDRTLETARSSKV